MATKTTAGTKAGTKTGFKQDVGFQRSANWSVGKSRDTLNTGGGEPIPAGHKRTHEYRVLQPRDPETGRFDYNSSANISRKYDYHAERNGSHGGEGGGGDRKTLPYFARGWLAKFAEEGVRKGDIIEGDYQRYISTIDMTPEEFRDQIENYLEDENGGTHLGNDYNWMKLGGKMSGGSGTGDNKESSLDHFKNAVAKRTAAYKADPHGHKLIPRFAPSDRKGGIGHTPKSGPAKPSTPTTPTTPKAPKPTAPKPSAPSAPSAPKPEAPKSTTSGKFGDISDAKNYPGKYMSEHKDLVNKIVSSLKASGVDATPDAVVSAISESSPEELDEIAAELGL